MIIWMILDHDRKAFEIAFETKVAAEYYKEKCGNPDWLITSVKLLSERETKDFCLV